MLPGNKIGGDRFPAVWSDTGKTVVLQDAGAPTSEHSGSRLLCAALPQTHHSSIKTRDGDSIISFTRRKNMTASRPSTSR